MILFQSSWSFLRWKLWEGTKKLLQLFLALSGYFQVVGWRTEGSSNLLWAFHSQGREFAWGSCPRPLTARTVARGWTRGNDLVLQPLGAPDRSV
jgi:hypothetical protein